jgi:hypothetical protein
MFLLNGLVRARRSRAVGRGMVNWVCDVPNFSVYIPATAQLCALACATKATRLLMAAQRLS